MSGITLPAIRGAFPVNTQTTPTGLESRPSSSSSTNTNLTNVPHVYYSDYCVFKSRVPSGRPGIPRAYTKLPSLRHDTATSHDDIHARYSAKYRRTPEPKGHLSADSPFMPKAPTEECLKCLLKVPHKKCEAHKYIRVGGGYRHGYWYVKCLLEELELQRQRELIMKQRLETIKEKRVKAVKTYIRTKSGRLVERIIFMSEDDYEEFRKGKNAQDILKRYLTKDEATGLESWDKDEVKAIKTLVRTKSGRLIEKVVYVSKDEYEAITTGKVDAKDILKKYVKTGEGETIEGWQQAEMKTIKTYVRTKSGRLVEKVIMISQEDYDAMIKEGKNPNDIIAKYLPLGEGEQLESWQSTEPMKVIKTMVRTKSGRLIEKTIYVSADDYDKMTKGGADPNEILKKYIKDEDGLTIESWSKAEPQGMKVIKTFVRTKSGRLIEKEVLLTEEEYKQFQESGGDPDFLKKFIKLEKGEEIEDWEKASTVYSAASDDPDHADILKAKPGQRIVGKDGQVYEVVVDPLTGKKYKKKVGGVQDSDVDSGIASLAKGTKGKRGKGGGINEEEETPEQRHKRKQGKRDNDSDSDYSYKSHVSAGGTRRVTRRRKKEDGTYSDPESYHSDKDKDGDARRRRRRREREHGPDSAHSYYSVVSDGGTRHVKRKKKLADGTYGDSESYHSSDSGLDGGKKGKKKKDKKRREHGSDSDHSYTSQVSAGGTRTRTRRKKIKDEHGNVIGYEKAESYTSDSDDESVYTTVSDGKGGKMKIKKEKPGKKGGGRGGKGGKAGKGGKGGKGGGGIGGDDSGTDFSDATTDSEAVDLENMTEEEKQKYFEKKAKKAAEREKKRREKYGDKYDEVMATHEEKKKKKKIQEMIEKGLLEGDADDWEIGSDGKPRKLTEEQKKKKKLEQLKKKGLITGDVDDWEIGSDGVPVKKDEYLAKKGRKGRKGKDGNEADDESDENTFSGKTKGQKGRKVVDRNVMTNEDGKSAAYVGNSKALKKTLSVDSGNGDDSDGGNSTNSSQQAEKEEDSDNDEVESNSTSSDLSSDDEGVSSDSDYSDYSFASEVSEGGTRYEMRRKRIRDVDGNIVGYGSPEPVEPCASDNESTKLRRGSISDSEIDQLFTEQLQELLTKDESNDFDPAAGDPINNADTETPWPGIEMSRTTPSDFSDASTDDDVDLSKMTAADKRRYLAEREKRRQVREQRRRQKYGDKYDEIMARRQLKRQDEMAVDTIRQEKEKLEEMLREISQVREERRASRSSSQVGNSAGKRPQSMVTYGKGPPRKTIPNSNPDHRDPGMPHKEWGQHSRRPSLTRRNSNADTNGDDLPPIRPRLFREPTMFTKLPPIQQNGLLSSDDEEFVRHTSARSSHARSSIGTKSPEKPPVDTILEGAEDVLEIDKDGKLRLKKKKVDLNKLTDEQLRRMGIDPTMSKKEIAKKLKELYGDDITVTDGDNVIGTKGLDQYHKYTSDEALAADPDLDTDTLKPGTRRVNILMKRGGSAILKHMANILRECNLDYKPKGYAKDLDERDSSIDFVSHYRLVNPGSIEGYARAFVVEDDDIDKVINFQEIRIALEGVPTIQNVTTKEMDYVLKVLHIDDASQITFRMFAVITALCERVTSMDSLSKHLLEICSLADIERKLTLYKAMFYHNNCSDRDSNFITSESLTVELIAGGLNWKQQKFVMDKMEPNGFGEISFLDYMCYIPLFLSMHDNICDNPLDMSNEKYQMPPRKRPPSVQRDMNPLGNPLLKQSPFIMRQRAKDLKEGKIKPDEISREYRELLKKWSEIPDPAKSKLRRVSYLNKNEFDDVDLIY